jgi:hypothetical protein
MFNKLFFRRMKVMSEKYDCLRTNAVAVVGSAAVIGGV